MVATVLESGQPAGKEKIVIYTPAVKLTKDTIHPGSVLERQSHQELTTSTELFRALSRGDGSAHFFGAMGKTSR